MLKKYIFSVKYFITFMGCKLYAMTVTVAVENRVENMVKKMV